MDFPLPGDSPCNPHPSTVPAGAMWMPFSCFQNSQQKTRAQTCWFNSDQTFLATLPRTPSAPSLGTVSFPCLLAMFSRSCYFRPAVCTKLALENMYSCASSSLPGVPAAAPGLQGFACWLQQCVLMCRLVHNWDFCQVPAVLIK